MDSAENGWWITESTTYKIFAKTEEEARAIWNEYYTNGADINTLDIKTKSFDVEADWNWEND